MKDLVGYIRSKAGLSRDEFAFKIGVETDEVNSWENGFSIPDKEDQISLFSFCKDNNIDIVEYVYSDIKSRNHGENTLYHGSRDGLLGPGSPISNSRCDFGPGFYTALDPMQSLIHVCGSEKPKLYTFRFNSEDSTVLHIEDPLDWAMLVAYFRGYMDEDTWSEAYRKYSLMTEGYDIVAGYIADDRIYPTLIDFFEGQITDEVLIDTIETLKLGTQYVGITQHGCEAFALSEKKLLQPIELLALREKGKQNRAEGIRISNEVRHKSHPRGKYFNELL